MLRLLLFGGLLATGVLTSTDPDYVKLIVGDKNATDDAVMDQHMTENGTVIGYSYKTSLDKKMPNKSSPASEALLPTVDLATKEKTPYGELGLNYYMDKGKPYINCAVHSNPRPYPPDLLLDEDDGERNVTILDSSRTKQCFLEWNRHFERLACMAVFMYNGTDEELKRDKDPRRKIIIHNQNCWTNQHEAIETCSKGPKCVFTGILTAGKQHFCCCNEHNCNDQIHLEQGFPGISLEDEAKALEAAIEQEQKEEERERREGATSQIVFLIMMFIALILLLAVGCTLYALYRRHAKEQASGRGIRIMRKNDIEEEELLETRKKDGTITPEKWECIRRTMIEIGQGRFGTVYKASIAVLPNGEEKFVAVKVFKGNALSFSNELGIYQETCIKNSMKTCILKLLDYDKEEQTLVTEYYPLGNLANYLQNNVIEVNDCLTTSVSLLDGLSFLHEERSDRATDPKPVILHRDIKSFNVLVKRDSRGRLVGILSDFGLSMRCSQAIMDTPANNLLHKVVGTQRYMAPELLQGSAELDVSHFKAIDIYAMALVLWEVLSRTKLHPLDEPPAYSEPLESDLRREQPVDTIRLGTYRLVVVSQKRRPHFRQKIKKEKHLNRLAGTIEEMWEHDAGCRISAACALRRIEQLVDEGYHSGTIEDSVKSESDSEKTTASPAAQLRNGAVLINVEEEIVDSLSRSYTSQSFPSQDTQETTVFDKTFSDLVFPSRKTPCDEVELQRIER